jgi:hypothetical protein
MTGKEKIAAALLTLTAIVYAVIPPIVDINATHILNPEWTAHARFHTVWQVSSTQCSASCRCCLSGGLAQAGRCE